MLHRGGGLFFFGGTLLVPIVDVNGLKVYYLYSPHKPQSPVHDPV